MTFSAPKSVSVVWGIAELRSARGSARAHPRVERTLRFAEEQQLFITRLVTTASNAEARPSSQLICTARVAKLTHNYTRMRS